MIPRFGKIDPRQTYRPRPGAYALLLRGDRALLTFQASEDEYQLPGGGIDPGEHPLPALHREVLEETGWTMAGARFLCCYRRFCYMRDYGFWAEKICSIWIAKPGLRRGPPLEAGHREEWVALRDVPELLGDEGSRSMIADALRHPHLLPR